MKIFTITLKIIKFIIYTIIVAPICIVETIKVAIELRKVQRVIIYHYGWGFAHTIADAELIRRLDNIRTALVFIDIGKHNHFLSCLFDDIDLKFIRIYKKFNIMGRRYCAILPYRLRKSFFNVISFIINSLVPSNLVITFEDFISYYSKKYPMRAMHKFTIIDEPYARNTRSMLSDYFESLAYEKNYLTPEIKDFDIVREQCEKYYLKDIKEINKKMFCFYIRNKGDKKNNINEYLRNSSSWANYIPVFEYLVDNGYYIFIYGDYDFNNIRHDINRLKISCCESLSVSCSAFSLFSALNCSFFCASAGGGAFLPLLRNNMPAMIAVNYIPFGQVLPNSIMVYKDVINCITGDYLTPKDLVTKYSYNISLRDHVIVDNSSTLILESIKDLLDNISLYKETEGMSKLCNPDWVTEESEVMRLNSIISPIWINHSRNSMVIY